MDDATAFLLRRLRAIGGGAGYIDPDELLKLGTDVGGFDKRLEEHVVGQGWFRETPAKATGRWVRPRGARRLLGGIGLSHRRQPAVGRPRARRRRAGRRRDRAAGPARWSMPSRTMPGSMIRAMLEAYRRTLEKTMAQARSMGEVVADGGDPADRVARRRRRLGRRAGPPEGGRARPRADGRRRRAGVAPLGYLPLGTARGGSGGGSGGGRGGWARA